MRLLLLILTLTINLYAQAEDWAVMSQAERDMILWARDQGAKVGYPELGAHWMVESHGDSTAIRIESNGDRCVGAGQNNARLAAIRVYGESYTLFQLLTVEWLLTQDRIFAVEQSLEHIKVCLAVTEYRWNTWKCYNNIEAKSERYPALIQAHDKFLETKTKKR